MKILITGNGFDLNEKLPTSYENFIDTLEFVSENETENILERYQYISTNENIEEVITAFKGELKNNWFQYFRHQFQIDTWIDFESKLESTLERINYYINHFDTHIYNDDVGLDEHLETKNYIRNKSNDIFLLDIFDILRFPKQYKNMFFQLNESLCYVNKSLNIACGFKTDDFFTKLVDDWNAFMKLFNDYLKIFVEPLIQKIDSDKIYNIDYHFTFNYTDTYLKRLNQNVVTEHLHGKINDLNESKIVMGYNSEGSARSNKNLIPFTKNYQRMLYQTKYNFFNGFKYDLSNAQIYVWGHSLDITDKFFLDQIVFDIDSQKMRSSVFVIFYRKSFDKLLKNLIHIYGDEYINKLYLKNKIRFIEATDENINKELKATKMVKESFN